jgi:putative ABC transport system substrate-binding protein
LKQAPSLFVLAFQPLPFRQPEDFDGTFANLERDRPDALLITTDAMTILNQKRVVDSAERMRLPTMYELREPIYRGGPMPYGPSAADMSAHLRILGRQQPQRRATGRPADVATDATVFSVEYQDGGREQLDNLAFYPRVGRRGD